MISSGTYGSASYGGTPIVVRIRSGKRAAVLRTRSSATFRTVVLGTTKERVTLRI